MKSTFNKPALIAGVCLAALTLISFTVDWPKVESQAAFSVEYDTDRGGGDYKQFELAEANHEVCRNACAADGNCKAYTYTKPFQQYPAKCWLKNVVSNPVPYRSCCISGVKGAAFNSREGMGPREDGVSLKGTNLSYYHRPAFETCQGDCMNNGNCKGFTWIQPGTYNANDPAMCYLMSAVSGRTAARGHYSGVKGASGGVSTTTATATVFGGTWDFYAWDVITIEQNGNQVTGRYTGLGSGTFQGTVNGGKLFFSFRNAAGGVGEAVMALANSSDGTYGLNYCDGRGCDPMKQGYVGGRKRR